MSKIINEALVEYKAMMEEAQNAAKNRLSKEMSGQFDKFLKEEIQKKFINESMIEQQSDSIVSDGKEDSMALKSDEMPSVTESTDNVEDCNVNESEEEINLEELKEAMEELNMDDEEQIVDEHDMSLKIDFDADGIHISDASSDEQEFDDVDFDLDGMDGEEMGDVDSEIGSDELDLGDDSLEIDDSEEEESAEGEIDLDFEDDDTLAEEDFNIDEFDIEEFDEFEDEVEEGLAHTMTHQNARQVGSEGNVNPEKEQRLRFAVREGKELKAKVAKLMKENKELAEVNKGFKTSITKYKDQLFEMVFHNANLSHVNNLFVEHTTSIDEKTQIIEKFSNVMSIDESKKLYKEMKQTLTESKKDKKTIEESVSKASTIDESVVVKQTTSYEDESVARIKSMINRMEGRN